MPEFGDSSGGALVKKLTLLSIPVTFSLFVALAIPQSTHPGMSPPPPPLDPDRTTTQEHPPAKPTRHLDPVQLQKDADDLARMAQTIPSDVASVRQGMLPKDVMQKLKQIEKLSKRLRGELTP
jgi:hypothetical protein